VETLSIRDAVWYDLGDLADLFVRSSLANENERAHLRQNPETLEFSDLAVREGRTRVATTDGHIVGFATTLVLEDVVELEDLFVEPGGWDEGWAGRLVLDVVAIARRHGIARVEVTGNNEARGFYAKVGFVFDNEVEVQFGSGLRMHLDICPDPA